MSSYTISKKLNPNKVFILQKSELEKRFDPQFYINRVKIKNSIKLSKLVKVRGGKRIPKGKYYSEKPTDYQYLRVGDMLNFGLINWNGLKFIPEDVYYFLERYKVEKGDVIISIAGTVGKTALIEKEIKNTILTENCAILEIRDKSILLPKYLHILLELSTSKRQIELGFIQTTIPKLGFDKIQQLELPPIPTIDRQSEIIEFYENTISTKQENETKSKNLLNSIDTYLLKELGITLPKKEENTLKSRIFTASIKTLSGKRFDPYHHQMNFTINIDAIKKSKYGVKAFKHLIDDLKNGVEIRNYVEKAGVRYLRVTDLGKNGLNHKSPKYILEQEIPDKIKLNKNCILISRSGSLGLVNIVEESIENAILSSHIFKVQLKTDLISPTYLEAYLRSNIGQSEIFRNNNGGVIPEINQEALKSIFIVIPPLEKQLEIAEHISAIRKQAQDLKDQTKLLLEKANKEIEDILLNT